MQINIYVVIDSKLKYAGYIEAEGFNADKCYETCNWQRWTKTMPDNLHVNPSLHMSLHSKRICFKNPETNELWLAKSIGWFTGNIMEVYKYIEENANELLWL